MMSEKPVLEVGSLFSGISGIELGLSWAFRFQTIWQCEINEYSRKVLMKHAPDTTLYRDIGQVDWSKVRRPDVICGGFPCFPAGTLIHTNRGLVPIEEVKKNDKALTHKQKWNKVKCTMNRETNEIYQIKIRKHPPMKTTSEHPFYAIEKKRKWNNTRRSYDHWFTKPSWIEAKNLTKNHYIASPKHYSLEDENQHDHHFWYLVGRYLGDGWIVNHKRTSKIPQGQRGSRINSKVWKVVICANKKDLSLEKAITDAGYHFTKAEERTVMKYHISSKELVLLLEKYGRGAKNKSVCDLFSTLSKNNLQALFNGWVDSDGNKDETKIQATTISKELAYGMFLVARRLYGSKISIYYSKRPRTHVIEGRVVNQNPTYVVRILKSKAKSQTIDKHDLYWNKVLDVDKVEEAQQVYNLEVENDNSYVANDIIVHNCQDISIAGKGEGIHGERSGLWFEMWKAIKYLRPNYAIMENVAMLLRRGIDIVLGSLAEIGYDAEWTAIRASDFGAPHRRERIFIVAYPSSFRCGSNEVPSGIFGEKIRETSQGQLIRTNSLQGVRSFSDTNSNGTEWAQSEDRKGSRSEQVCTDFPNSQSQGRQRLPIRQGRQDQEASDLIRSGEDVSDSERERRRSWDVRRNRIPRDASIIKRFWADFRRREAFYDGREWWKSEPQLGRVVAGVPNRVDDSGAESFCKNWFLKGHEEEDVRRTAVGIRNRMDRLKALGNAVVPFIGQAIGETLIEFEEAYFSE